MSVCTKCFPIRCSHAWEKPCLCCMLIINSDLTPLANNIVRAQAPLWKAYAEFYCFLLPFFIIIYFYLLHNAASKPPPWWFIQAQFSETLPLIVFETLCWHFLSSSSPKWLLAEFFSTKLFAKYLEWETHMQQDAKFSSSPCIVWVSAYLTATPPLQSFQNSAFLSLSGENPSLSFHIISGTHAAFKSNSCLFMCKATDVDNLFP